MDADLVAGGAYVRIEATGRSSGVPRPVTVGYVREADGSLLVAARSADTAWALNLLAEPACRVTVGEQRFAAVAEPLDRDDHVRAIRALILRYGTPAKSLGRGPSFRLRRIVAA